MGAGRDVPADLGEMCVEGVSVGEWHHHGSANAALRTGRAEDVGPVITLVAGRARTRSLFGPDTCQASLLADPCFILEPDFERLAVRVFRKTVAHGCGEVFLYASCTSGSDFGCCGRTDRRT